MLADFFWALMLILDSYIQYYKFTQQMLGCPQIFKPNKLALYYARFQLSLCDVVRDSDGIFVLVQLQVLQFHSRFSAYMLPAHDEVMGSQLYKRR